MDQSSAVNEMDLGGLTVVLGRAGEGRITLGPISGGAREVGYLRVPVLVEALGLSASSYVELEDWGSGRQGMIDFFMMLAASWRGWPGEKAWQDDHAGIHFLVTHDGIGTVTLRVSMTARRTGIDIGAWKLETALGLDPGSLDATAAAVRRLLLP